MPEGARASLEVRIGRLLEVCLPPGAGVDLTAICDKARARLEPQDVLEDRAGCGNYMEVEVVENCLPVELVVERRYRIGPVCETQASPLLCVAEAIGVEAVGCETQPAFGKIYP